MKEFNCMPGECSKCCTDLAIPVTLGDLYRAWTYERSKAADKSLYQVFDERCSGWMTVPHRNSHNPIVVPMSRKPCYNLDPAKNTCGAYNTARYAVCAQFPEENLLVVPDDAIDFNKLDPKRANIISSYDCLRGVELTAERTDKLWKLVRLTSDEIYITGMTLNNPAQPAMKSYDRRGLEQADAELRNRIRWLSTPQFMAQAWINIGQTQGRYMELFGVAEPDYTRPPLSQARRIGNIESFAQSKPQAEHLNRAERRRLERERK